MPICIATAIDVESQTDPSRTELKVELACLMIQLQQATVETYKWNIRLEDLKRIIQRRSAEKSKLATLHFSSAAHFQARNDLLDEAKLDQAKNKYKEAKLQMERLPTEIAEELRKLATPKDTSGSVSRLNTLETRLEEALSKLEALTRKYDEDHERISLLEISNQALKSQNAALESRSNSLFKQLNAAEKRANILETNINAMESTAQTYRSDAISTADLVNNLKLEMEDIQTKLRQGLMVDSSGAVAFESRVTDLELELKKSKSALEDAIKEKFSEIDVVGLDEAIALTDGLPEDRAQLTQLIKENTARQVAVDTLVTHVNQLEKSFIENKTTAERELNGLKVFDKRIVDKFGGMVDKLKTTVSQLEGRVKTLEKANSPQALPPSKNSMQDVATNTQLLQLQTFAESLKTHIVKAEKDIEQVTTAHKLIASKVEGLVASVEPLYGVQSHVEDLEKRTEGWDLQLGSLENRWNNIHTKEFAERVVGYVSQLHPPVQDLALFKTRLDSVIERIKPLETQLENNINSANADLKHIVS